MRNISFALTTAQFLAGSKTVTRRIGWKNLKAGDLLCAVKKSRGLRKGERVEKLGIIRVVSVRRERLRLLCDDLDYGFAETTREGFPEGHDLHWPSAFIDFFCNTHKGVTLNSKVTRIKFEKVPE